MSIAGLSQSRLQRMHQVLNQGRHGREQVLSRAAVELMTSDQLTPEQPREPKSFSVRMAAAVS
jgi:hypothetical protein